MTSGPSPRVTAIWRYPVSSMAGERLDSATVEVSGLAGDREWGVFDLSADKIAYPGREKRWLAVPNGHARLARSGAVEVSADGDRWGDPASAPWQQSLSDLFGFPAELRAYVPPEAEGMKPRYERAPLHILTTAALRSLRRALPDSVIDERRFRPNLLVDIPDGAEPIPENDWIGRDITIGGVTLRGSEPCARCGFTTLQQDGLPLDIEVLRTVVKRFGRNFGIYCDVVSPGEINQGDVLTIGDRSA